MSDCLPCEVAKMRRANAILRNAPHALAMPERCELHGALHSAGIENALRKAQALHEELDGECRAAETRNGKAFAVARVLNFPFGAPRTACHPARMPVQGETTLAWAKSSASNADRRAHELGLLRQAVASGMVRKVG